MSYYDKWKQRGWLAVSPSTGSTYVIWDIPHIRDSLIADYKKQGWSVHGPYEVPPYTNGARAHRLAIQRAHSQLTWKETVD